MEIAQAVKKSISIIDYARMRGFTVKRVGTNEYTLAEHDSVRINSEKNVFFRHSTGQCGSIIDFEMMIDGVNVSRALSILRGYLQGRDLSAINSKSKIRASPPAQEEHKELVLPPPTKGRFSRVYAYLVKSRGIDREIINDMIQRKQLYEDINHNCVFVGYDKNGKAAYANIRGTLTDKGYKGEAKGSDKQVGFYIKNGSSSLFVTEAAIDALSIATMLKLYGKDYKKFDYLSLGGTSSNALIYNLNHNPKLNCIYLALDNDSAGQKGRQGIIKALSEAGYQGKVIDKPPVCKDYNDDLRVFLSKSREIERSL